MAGRTRIVRCSHTYSKTLNLPKSSFPNRPDRKSYPGLIKQTSDELYRWQQQNLQGRPYILHDGPPYANGVIHLGHALNKILKDVINRFNVLVGRRVSYVPGWDCHGLPIEIASLENAKKKGKTPKSNTERRALATQLAVEMIEKQKAGFREFAVMADWDNNESIYRTFTGDYVVRQLRVFGKMMRNGLIFRQRKPVYWSVESGTALAESELQYGQHKSISAYVLYPLEEEHSLGSYPKLSLAIWTTTPWTLPANRAIAVNPDMCYCVVDLGEFGQTIVAENLMEKLGEHKLLGKLDGKDLVGLKYSCPLTSEQRPVVPGSHVTDTSGTGLVHSAPGHGKEDYALGSEFGIEVYSPVDARGRYTAELPPALSELVGLDARKDGANIVLRYLKRRGALFKTENIEHSVPFDWRSKTPVMIRSTPQFFVSLESIKETALKAIETVKFRPESAQVRLRSFVKSRSDWCISRQRVWGVPIPVVYDKESGGVVMNPETVNHIIDRIEAHGEQGVAKWFEPQEDITEWLPEPLASNGGGTRYYKGVDTMDVWFDSGTSWSLFDSKQVPVDYYLEGTDQHRGWFQSSLLTYVATNDVPLAPYKRLITHGFLLDEHQQKMSKSLGNVVSPKDLIHGNSKFAALGIDGLRLFLSQADYTSDIALSSVAVSQVAATVKKLRLTFKFLLGNLSGFEAGTSASISYSPVDKYALSELAQLANKVKEAYDNQNFSMVVKCINIHMNSVLSAFYFDVCKDMLYTATPSDPQRQAVQAVLYEILKVYVAVISPIMPLLSQEVWNHCPESLTGHASSPFMKGWPDVPQSWIDTSLIQEFTRLQQLKDAVNETIELARAEKKVGSSLACLVSLEVDGEDADLLSKYSEYLEQIFVASKVNVGPPPAESEWLFQSGTNPRVSVTPPSSSKCPRCWQYTSEAEDSLCTRCESIVNE